MTDGEWQNPLQRGAPLVDTATHKGGLTPALSTGKNDNIDTVVEDTPTDSGGMSTADPDEPVMASPRFIPVPDSLPLSARAPSGQLLDDMGQNSGSFDRTCAPSQSPEFAITSYDHLPYGQLRKLRRQRGYHEKDSKAVLNTRLETMDAVESRLLMAPRMIWIRRRLFRGRGPAIWMGPRPLKPRRWGRM